MNGHEDAVDLLVVAGEDSRRRSRPWGPSSVVDLLDQEVARLVVVLGFRLPVFGGQDDLVGGLAVDVLDARAFHLLVELFPVELFVEVGLAKEFVLLRAIEQAVAGQRRDSQADLPSVAWVVLPTGPISVTTDTRLGAA